MYADYTIHDGFQSALRQVFHAAALGYGAVSASARLCGNPAAGREFSAAAAMFDRGAKSYPKPAFGLTNTPIGGVRVPVREEIVWQKPYCNLLHFQRDTDRQDPKLLLVAPMSGHYATLLRGTAEALLPHHDVYVTDWVNARDVPAQAGGFGLADYAGYVTGMLEHLGPDTHVIAVCQPVVPVLAAISLMAADDHPAQPLTMTLMGGPVDARAAPTAVTRFAETRTLDWFKRNALSSVPFGYAGAGQAVYPGFKQLTGFLAMNPDRHARSAWDMYKHLRQGDAESADKIAQFYDEYLAVMDIPAQFYLETVDEIFQRHTLPKGEMFLGGQRVDPSRIRRTALLTVEGEKDDISAPGQTLAAHRLVNNLPSEKHFHHLQAGCGHYGIFEGRRWRDEICPRITRFIRSQAVDNGLKYSDIPTVSGLMPSNLQQDSGTGEAPAPNS